MGCMYNIISITFCVMVRLNAHFMHVQGENDFGDSGVKLFVVAKPQNIIYTVHLVSMPTRCFRYFRKTGSPSQKILVVKKKKKKLKKM